MRQHLPPLIKKKDTNVQAPKSSRASSLPTFDDTFILTKYRRVRIACLVKSDHRSGTIHAAWVHLTKENMSLKRMHNKETKINVPV